MKLIIFGAPGAGKGTISHLLAKYYRLKHISMGEVIRKEIEKKTKLGKRIEPIVDKGHLISDELLEELLIKILPKDNFILDGSPRTINEKKFLDKIFSPDHIIFINTSKREILSRLKLRYECQRCGRVYGKDILPKKKWICDYDKIKLERRQDDDPKVVSTRFNVYNKETKPVLRLYKKNLLTINGNKKPELIFKEIKNLLR